jgi:hypothetical protein
LSGSPSGTQPVASALDRAIWYMGTDRSDPNETIIGRASMSDADATCTQISSVVTGPDGEPIQDPAIALTTSPDNTAWAALGYDSMTATSAGSAWIVGASSSPGAAPTIVTKTFAFTPKGNPQGLAAWAGCLLVAHTAPSGLALIPPALPSDMTLPQRDLTAPPANGWSSTAAFSGIAVMEDSGGDSRRAMIAILDTGPDDPGVWLLSPVF